MILRYKAKVERYIKQTASASGAPSYQLTTVTASLSCDLQPHEGAIIYPEHGQTTKYYMTMFCYPTDIQPNDIVTDVDNPTTKMKVISVNSFNILKHYEVTLEGGVTSP